MSRVVRRAGVSRVLAAAVLAVIAVAPVSAHHSSGHTARQIKKVSKALKQTSASLEDRIARAATPFGPTVVSTSNETPLIVYPPITIKGRCAVDGSDLDAEVLIETTEDGTAFGGDDAASGSIGPMTPESERLVSQNRARSSGPPAHSDGYDDQLAAISASGRAINATVSAFAHKDGGVCRFYGHWTAIS